MKLIWIVFCLFALGTNGLAEEILVAAAADLNQVLPAIAQRFEHESGITVKLSFASSGNLFAQIENGAPFDVFLSADLDFPKRLEANGVAQPGSPYEYARGRIALWVPTTSRIDVSKGLPVLLDPHVQKIAIANPAYAPYGRAAVEALQHVHLLEKLKEKFVMGENISQTFELVHSGNADVGIVALSLTTRPAAKDTGRVFVIPTDMYPAIRQGSIILKSSKHASAARSFLAFLKSPQIVELWKQYGFDAQP